MGLIVAAQIRKNCRRKIKEANARSPETAVLIDQLRLTSWEMKHLSNLIKEKLVGKTEDGRVFVVCKDDKHC